MAATFRFWTTVLIAATVAILFVFSACLGADAEAAIEGGALEAAASPLVQ